MVKKNIISIAIVLFLSNFGNVYSEENKDGNWWRTLSTEQKIYYLNGIIDGLELGQTFLSMNERKNRTEVIVTYFLNKEKYFEDVTFTQLIDGLEVFFSDFRNRCIKTNLGIFIVLKMIRGDSEEEIKTMINNLRAFPIDKEKISRELKEKQQKQHFMNKIQND